MNEQTYQSCGSVIKILKWNKENQPMEPMYVEREIGINVLNYVDFQRYAL